MTVAQLFLRGGTSPSELEVVLGLLSWALPPLVIGGLLFGLYLAGVILARSASSGLRPVGLLLSLILPLVAVGAIESPRLADRFSLLFDVLSVLVIVGAAVLLTASMLIDSTSSFAARLVRRRNHLLSASLVLGVFGVIGFAAINGPVQTMGQGGVGPDNIAQYDMLSTLRDNGPIAAAAVAATLGAVVWRTTGRIGGAAATLLGCIGIGTTLWMLFLQTAFS